MSTLFGAIEDTLSYYLCLWYFITNGTYSECPYFSDRRHAKVQVYSLAVMLYLWNQPHYRNGTFQQDMLKNLRNVAIPGTGIPLSYFCYYKWTAILFLVVFYPLIALISAIHIESSFKGILAYYSKQLLCPEDWFSFWRLNCRLASFHSLILGTKVPGYAMEDKWLFLKKAESKQIPVSPWLNIPRLVVKDKNEEGGMGIKFFENATKGGDWIIQEVLENDEVIGRLLPPNAPLSTLRIITASTYGIPNARGELQKCPKKDDIISMSCVFRAGRAGASTDHSSILFDVDLRSGEILRGTTNAHWYRLGLKNVLRTPWVSTHDATHHPDCGTKITGEFIPEIDKIKRLVENAHMMLLPDVPLAGWDVALTNKGMLLLEVNLSCNFFRGTFDIDMYIRFMDDYFLRLDALFKASGNKAMSA